MTKSLASKLGIKPDDTVCLLNPDEKTVARLREDSGDSTKYLDEVTDGCDVILVWVSTSDNIFDLMSRLQTLIKPSGRIWLIIPRKDVAKRKGIELDWDRIQTEALKTHLVDNKIASISDGEYGTQFVLRKEYR